MTRRKIGKVKFGDKEFVLPPEAARHASRIKPEDLPRHVRKMRIKGEERVVYTYRGSDGRRHVYILDRKKRKGVPFDRALEFHKGRSEYSRASDESRRASVVLSVPTEAWMKRPGKYDVKGIDDGTLKTVDNPEEVISRRMKELSRKSVEKRKKSSVVKNIEETGRADSVGDSRPQPTVGDAASKIIRLAEKENVNPTMLTIDEIKDKLGDKFSPEILSAAMFKIVYDSSIKGRSEGDFAPFTMYSPEYYERTKKIGKEPSTSIISHKFSKIYRFAPSETDRLKYVGEFDPVRGLPHPKDDPELWKMLDKYAEKVSKIHPAVSKDAVKGFLTHVSTEIPDELLETVDNGRAGIGFAPIYPVWWTYPDWKSSGAGIGKDGEKNIPLLTFPPEFIASTFGAARPVIYFKDYGTYDKIMAFAPRELSRFMAKYFPYIKGRKYRVLKVPPALLDREEKKKLRDLMEYLYNHITDYSSKKPESAPDKEEFMEIIESLTEPPEKWSKKGSSAGKILKELLKKKDKPVLYIRHPAVTSLDDASELFEKLAESKLKGTDIKNFKEVFNIKGLMGPNAPTAPAILFIPGSKGLPSDPDSGIGKIIGKIAGKISGRKVFKVENPEGAVKVARKEKWNIIDLRPKDVEFKEDSVDKPEDAAEIIENYFRDISKEGRLGIPVVIVDDDKVEETVKVLKKKLGREKVEVFSENAGYIMKPRNPLRKTVTEAFLNTKRTGLLPDVLVVPSSEEKKALAVFKGTMRKAFEDFLLYGWGAGTRKDTVDSPKGTLTGRSIMNYERGALMPRQLFGDNHIIDLLTGIPVISLKKGRPDPDWFGFGEIIGSSGGGNKTDNGAKKKGRKKR